MGAERECVQARGEGQEYGFADFRQFRGGGHTTTRRGTQGGASLARGKDTRVLGNPSSLHSTPRTNRESVGASQSHTLILTRTSSHLSYIPCPTVPFPRMSSSRKTAL